MKQRTPLEENTYIDAMELAAAMERPFTNADIVQYQEQGLDLQVAAEIYVERFEGEVNFINSVRSYMNRRGNLTGSQARAVLNIMRDDVRGLVSKGRETTTDSRSQELHECIICHEEFDRFDDLDLHRKLFHGGEARPKVFTDEGQAEEVLEVIESKKGLDLSKLPDGRYAAPDRTGKNDYIFLAVKRVRRTKKVDRRYRYGKIVTGNEVVVAGTIEVRIWSSDTKEWVGQQKPGDVYRGKHEDDLELIMMAPEQWAILFGRLLGFCGRCGKKLTDNESRAIGLGLECEKKRAEFKSGPKYTYIGKDRPDKDRVNPLDEKYLSGELRSWREPPKTPVESSIP